MSEFLRGGGLAVQELQDGKRKSEREMSVVSRSRAGEAHVSGIEQGDNDGLFDLVTVSKVAVELEGNGNDAQCLLIELVAGIEVMDILSTLVSEEENELSLVSSGDGVSDDG